MLSLTPTIFHTEARNQTDFNLQKALSRPTTPALYDFGSSAGDSRFTNARLGWQWRQRLGPVRMELGGGGGSFRNVTNSLRNEFNGGGAAPIRVLEDHTAIRENSVNLTLKATGVAGGSAAGGGEHSLVSGAEIDASHRNETRTSLQNGISPLLAYDDNLQASALRLAAYAQDEWNLSPSWGAHAGLRWEGITTRGDNGSTSASGELRPTNRSSVWTPLLHAVWKPDPKTRDQVRLSLTRSYRAPALGTLIARPTISRDYDPAKGGNIVTSPDTAGNLLELVVLSLPGPRVLVIHAMKVRRSTADELFGGA